jgi:hypothetical protein
MVDLYTSRFTTKEFLIQFTNLFFPTVSHESYKKQQLFSYTALTNLSF